MGKQKLLSKILISLFTVLAVAVTVLFSSGPQANAQSRRPSSVESEDEELNQEYTLPAEPVVAAAPASTTPQTESSFSSGANFLASLTRISTTEEPRPASLSVSFSNVARDSSYQANGITLHLEGSNNAQSAKIRKLLMSEFQLYPASCIQRLGVRHVVSAQDIHVEWPNGTTDTRTATLDPTNGIMIYADSLIVRGDRNIFLNYIREIQAYQNLRRERRTDPSFARYLEERRVFLLDRRAEAYRSVRDVIHIVHHEFYHYWDFKEDNNYDTDSEWSALNTAGFRYGNGGRFATGADQSVWNTAHAGFLNNYSRAGVDEDKAEIWGALLAHPTQLQERMNADPILTRKVALIKRRAARQCAEINDAFWARVQASSQARTDFLATIMQETDETAGLLEVPNY